MVASVMIKKSVSTHSCEHEGERVGIVCHINDDICMELITDKVCES